jgi:hypothetical protein
MSNLVSEGKPSVHVFLCGALDTAPEVGAVAIWERRLQAAAVGFVTLLPPEGSVPGGSVKMRPLSVLPSQRFKFAFTNSGSNFPFRRK